VDEQINNADLIVADMTGKDPNVYYEVGNAHALGKRVILVSQNSDVIQFDRKLHVHIVY
jgi:nucleoside 2-deoxyribosyltransferase